MASNPINTMDRFTSFSQEIQAVEALRKSRRSKIKKYPTVSVLVSTLRTDDLSNLLDQLLAQTLATFDLVLGLHTIELSASHKRQIAALNRRKVKVSVQKFSEDQTLGTILSTLASQSHGDYIAKMDDDDYYGPEHLRDLLESTSNHFSSPYDALRRMEHKLLSFGAIGYVAEQFLQNVMWQRQPVGSAIATQL